MSIDKDFIIFASTIYGEACGQSSDSWRAIANVIMNRVGKREWKKYTTPAQVAQNSGFDACTQRTPNYKYSEKEMNSVESISEIKDALVKKIALTVFPIFESKEEDLTKGCQLYYSPKAQKALNEKNPDMYPNIKPKWAMSNLLEEVVVSGTEKDDFAWYRYKQKAKISITVVDQINRPIKKSKVFIEYDGKFINATTDQDGLLKDLLVSLPSRVNIENSARELKFRIMDIKNNKVFNLGKIEIKKAAHYMLTLVSPEARIKTKTITHKGHKQTNRFTKNLNLSINSHGQKLEIKDKRSEIGHPVASVEINANKNHTEIVEGLLYPVELVQKDTITGSKIFGGIRDGGKRLHAGIDIYAPIGSVVRAMADGVIIKYYPFYGGTWAIEVDHGSFIARYGEVSQQSIVVKSKQLIKRGDTLAKIGVLMLFNKKLSKVTAYEHSMLHLEMYSTTVTPEGKNNLTNASKDNKYRRRDDLINPTESINLSTLT